MPELQSEYRDVQAAVTALFFIHSRWLPGNKILLSVSVIYWPILLVIMLLQFKTGPPFGQKEISQNSKADNNVYMCYIYIYEYIARTLKLCASIYACIQTSRYI